MAVPSKYVLAGRARRAGRGDVRWEWFDKPVVSKIKLSMKGRVMLATALLKYKVIENINRPVTKLTGPRGGKVVTDRSKAGEYPKADTGLLHDTIFDVVRQIKPGDWNGYVGTPLDYGVILETSKRLDRSFLVRTLNEQRPRIMRILSGPTK